MAAEPWGSDVRAEDGARLGSVSVEADGSYAIGQLATGTHRLKFTDHAYELAPGMIPSVVVTEGQVTTGQNITLVRGGLITGTVSGPNGVDLTRVLIVAHDEDDEAVSDGR